MNNMENQNLTIQEALQRYRACRKKTRILSLVGFALFVVGIVVGAVCSIYLNPWGMIAILPGFIVFFVSIFWNYKTQKAFFAIAESGYIEPLSIFRSTDLRIMDRYVSQVERKIKEGKGIGPWADDAHVYQPPSFEGKDRYDRLLESRKAERHSLSSTVNCPRCGYINDEEAEFCSQCGAPLPQHKNK